MITILKSSDNTQQKLQEILQRNQTEKNDIQQIVNDIVYDVKKNGDEALFRYTKEFDKIELTHQTVQVTEEEIKYAYTQVEQNLIKVIQKAAKRMKTER